MTSSRPTHLLSSYYAPRGAHRMYALGQQIAQLYLSPNDKLIGVIGERIDPGYVPGSGADQR